MSPGRHEQELTAAVLARLFELRGWTPEAIERLGLGFDGQRVLFPVYDESGERLGFTRYQPNGDRLRNGEPKMRADTGTSRELFPPPEGIADEELDELLWLVEGEPDAVRLWSLGLRAVGVPGAGNWRDKWAQRFSGRHCRVVVCFDCDEAGRLNAGRAGKALVAAGVDARVLDLAPDRDDGFDLSDLLAKARSASEREEARRILERCAKIVPPFEASPDLTSTSPASSPASAPQRRELAVVPLRAFVDVEEPGAEPVVGVKDDVVIGEGADAMFYGDGGAGKTTLGIDGAFHLAAGDEWLGIAVARPVRVLLVENEGPRPLYRAKLRRKTEAWGGSPVGDRISVLERPWGQLSLADPGWREALADAIEAGEIDVVIAGPVTRLGMNEAGTLQEVRDFMALVDDVRERSGRRVAVVLIHHENKGGKVSGAWEASGDTLVHVTGEGHGRLRLYFQKARWSSTYHATTLHLRWADGESFEVEEKVELDDDAIAEKIVAAVSANPGTGWTRVEKATPKIDKDDRRRVRDDLLRAGRIVNIGKNESGDEVALDHVPEKKRARLYAPDDPTIAHLRRDFAADTPQSAALWAAGDDSTAALRRPPIRGAAADAAVDPPPFDQPADEGGE